ncbi:hypothetical protein [Natrinema altunense]|uniref:Uncharacterized protein n=1 Tax=Natrinema altunense (strain JCM 12890 / CGMCC 1.3731 / AJ2) TaxID=1227494 RepID=L9ZQ39_NATA2|nr:hypothetical protein [Natrinema altunense]ELY88605.1 hypothetical protein C485_05593 [Natrinema altunense JCM 12890]
MSESFSLPVILDATVSSNFASTESVTWLTAVLENLTTVPAIEWELQRGIENGYPYLENALEAIRTGQIPLEKSVTEQLEQAYPTIRDQLDPGEAEAFVVADRTDGTLVTDDGAARNPASTYEINLTGSIGLLVRGVVRDNLTVETADSWFTTWVDECDYYAPVESVSDVLFDEYTPE